MRASERTLVAYRTRLTFVDGFCFGLGLALAVVLVLAAAVVAAGLFGFTEWPGSAFAPAMAVV